MVGNVRIRQFDGFSVARKCICPGAGRRGYCDAIDRYVSESKLKGLSIHEDRSLDEGFNRPPVRECSRQNGQAGGLRRAAPSCPGRNVGPPTFFCSTLTICSFPSYAPVLFPRRFVGPDYNGALSALVGRTRDCPAPWSWCWLALKHVEGTGTTAIQQVASPPSRGGVAASGRALVVQRSYCAFDGLDDWFRGMCIELLPIGCFIKLAGKHCRIGYFSGRNRVHSEIHPWKAGEQNRIMGAVMVQFIVYLLTTVATP